MVLPTDPNKPNRVNQLNTVRWIKCIKNVVSVASKTDESHTLIQIIVNYFRPTVVIYATSW